MKIGIVGTRGIPNHYGGFEQFAQHLAEGLTAKGHQVVVYNSHKHLWKDKMWNGVHIVHCFDPEYLVGTFGQFVYDFNCILDSRNRKFDLILQLGYTSSSVWGWMLPSAVVVTNMDGLEWKRSKYSAPVRKFLKAAERMAVKDSTAMVADSIGIQSYLKTKYNTASEYIPYGAVVFAYPEENTIQKFGLVPYAYDLLVARMEPENNIEMILEGFSASTAKRTLVVIGNVATRYGRYLKKKFTDKRIRFAGTVYDQRLLNNIRYYSNLYYHGHSVGGTNPSLLEAMACGALICAHQNEFNTSILDRDAHYFSSAQNVTVCTDKFQKTGDELKKVQSNLDKIKNIYTWETVINRYESFFMSLLAK